MTLVVVYTSLIEISRTDRISGMISKICCLLFLILILSTVPYATGQAVELNKRRIGMRLPNMLSLKPMVHKRRIGMRLPNIIYLRYGPEKKNLWERRVELLSNDDGTATNDAYTPTAANDASTPRQRRENHNYFSPLWMTSRIRGFQTMHALPPSSDLNWLTRLGKFLHF